MRAGRERGVCACVHAAERCLRAEVLAHVNIEIIWSPKRHSVGRDG